MHRIGLRQRLGEDSYLKIRRLDAQIGGLIVAEALLVACHEGGVVGSVDALEIWGGGDVPAGDIAAHELHLGL